MGNQSSSKAPEALADRWKIEQDALARFVEEANRLDFDLDAAAVAKESKESKESKGDAKEAKDKGRRALRLIGGVDISFVGEEDGKDGGQQQEEACAALVVCSFPDLKIVYEQYEMVKLTYPYVPGFLAFREVPALVRLLDGLRRTKPELMPQILMVDGNGILHPRGLGLASHLGVLLDIPTIGVAKTLLAVDGLTREEVEAREKKQLQQMGDSFELVGKSKRVWGVALRTNSVHPLYVSAGHRVSLQTAAALVARCSEFRIPTPVRAADLGSREYIRQWLAKGKPAPVSMAELERAFNTDLLRMRHTATEVDSMELLAYKLHVPSRPNLWLLSLARTKEARELRRQMVADEKSIRDRTRLHVTFVCDCSGSMGDNYKNLLIPACERAYRELRPESAEMVLFGEKVTRRTIATAGDISAMAVKELEQATNIAAGVEAAVAGAVKHVTDHRMEAALANKNLVYLFIFASDGQDTVTGSKAPGVLLARLDKCGEAVRQAEMQTLFSVVGIGAQSDTKIGMHAKRAVQTVQSGGGDAAVHYAHTPADIPKVIEQLTQEQVSQKGALMVKLQLAAKSTASDQEERKADAETKAKVAAAGGAPVAESKGDAKASSVGAETKGDSKQRAPGLLSSLSAVPAMHLASRLAADADEVAFLFQGDPAAFDFAMNGRSLKVSVALAPAAVDAKSDGAAAAAPTYAQPPVSLLLSAIEQLAQEVRVSSVVGHDTHADVAVLAELVRAMKQESFDVAKLRQAGANRRVTMMRLVKGRLAEVEGTINQLRDQVATMRSASSQQQAMFLKSATDLKYGLKAMRRSQSADAAAMLESVRAVLPDLRKLAAAGKALDEADSKEAKEGKRSDQQAVAEVKIAVAADSRQSDRESFLSALSETEHALQLLEIEEKQAASFEVLDLMYAFGMVGPLIQIHRNAAAAIDPWQIGVRYVSADAADSASCLCSLDSGHVVKDMQQQACEDVLMLLNPRNPTPARQFMRTQLYNVLLSLQFSRNLDLYVPAQRRALLCAALVRSIHQLRKKETRTLKHIQTVFDILYTLRTQFGQRLAMWPQEQQPKEGKQETKGEVKFETKTEIKADSKAGAVAAASVTASASGLGGQASDASKAGASPSAAAAPVHAPVQYKYQYSEHWHDWVTALAECKQPGTLMTEADGTAANSLTQLMGALLCAEGVTGKLVRDEKQFAEVTAAAMAESVSRCARGYVKDAATPPAYMQHMLGIAADSVPKPLADDVPEPNYAFDCDPRGDGEWERIVAESKSCGSSTAEYKGDAKGEEKRALQAADEQSRLVPLLVSRDYDRKGLARFASEFAVKRARNTNASCGAVLACAQFARVLQEQVIPLAEQQRRKLASTDAASAGDGKAARGAEQGWLALMRELESPGEDACAPLFRLVQKAFDGEEARQWSLEGFVERFVRLPDQKQQQQQSKQAVESKAAAAAAAELKGSDAKGDAKSDQQPVAVEESPALVAFRNALVVQGVRFHSSKDRRDGLPSLLSDPEGTVALLAAETRKLAYLDAASGKKLAARMKLVAARAAERERLEREARATFMQTHGGLPNMFSRAQLAEMNKGRPAEDQLEIVGASGLLKHHCAYPKCPLYLRSLALPSDVARDARSGLFQHLQPMMTQVFLRGLHVKSLGCLRLNPRFTEQQFVEYAPLLQFALSSSFRVLFRSAMLTQIAAAQRAEATIALLRAIYKDFADTGQV